MEKNECVYSVQSWLGVPHACIQDRASSALAGNMQDVLKRMTEHQEPVLEDVKQVGAEDDTGACSSPSEQLISATQWEETWATSSTWY